MYYQSSGLNLYYEKTGQGKPLILIHGNDEDHTIFYEAAGVLASRYTCYLLDSRGHGESDSVTELHYLDMAEDLIAFMEQNNLEDTAVYGFSDGGIIGLLAAMRTSRITRLVSCNGNPAENHTFSAILAESGPERRKIARAPPGAVEIAQIVSSVIIFCI